LHAKQQLAAAEARQQHLLLVRRRRLLMRQQLEALIADHQARGFNQVSAKSSSGHRERLRTEGRRVLLC